MYNIVKTEPSLLLFADIVNSSRHSSVLGPIQYAKDLLRFRSEFESLAKDHFREPTDKRIDFLKIESRGDEGIIFSIDKSSAPEDLIYKALQFTFELKGRLEILSGESSLKPPHPMKVGVGIHWGEVALITKPVYDSTTNRSSSLIEDISGYAINYAKRVESCSRIGNLSNIFISKEAAFYLDGFPVVLEEHTTEMKGINDHETVYEVRSAYFAKLPNNPYFKDNDIFIHKMTHFISEYSMIREPWQKGLMISILDTCYGSTPPGPSRSILQEKRSDLAWKNTAEDDPIILFLRAKQCEDECKFTQSIRYLKDLTNKYPQFIHAKLTMMRVCWALAEIPGENLDKLYARDVADEFLHRFPYYLTPKMKTLCLEIIEKCK
jgi:class 3 adenylate cyclase